MNNISWLGMQIISEWNIINFRRSAMLPIPLAFAEYQENMCIFACLAIWNSSRLLPEHAQDFLRCCIMCFDMEITLHRSSLPLTRIRVYTYACTSPAHEKFNSFHTFHIPDGGKRAKLYVFNNIFLEMWSVFLFPEGVSLLRGNELISFNLELFKRKLKRDKMVYGL